MRIKLEKSDALDDWYLIVRQKHDGKEWMEEIERNFFQLMMSERLVYDACIEGTSSEMLALADAIKSRSSASFKRCAVFSPMMAYIF